ncbi:MAG: tyrosine-type recombinase/integrase [bacterium]
MSDNIRKIGNIYSYDFMLDGRRYRGSCKTEDKKLAEHIADTIKADILRKKHSLPSLINYQFKDIWDNYIKSIVNSPRTLENKKIDSNHFLPVLGLKPVNNITLTDIKEYQLNRKIEISNKDKNINKREPEISYKTINLEIGTLSHFFNYCIEKNYIDKNPAIGIKKLNTLSRIKTLSDTDINKLIAGATNKLTRDLITFLIYTGCRKGEALNLKWDNVDLQNNVIAIKGTKTKYDRYIPIHTQLKELLSDIKNTIPESGIAEYVFNIAGKKIGNFRKSFMTACRNAGLKDMHIHDLRHVFASKMVMGGTSLYITGELLGHRTTQMTKRYSHLVPETLKKAVDDVWNKK